MPLNLIKRYPQLLELSQFNTFQRKESLMRIFKRDIEDNNSFTFRNKNIRPTKVDGELDMQKVYNHLTTRNDEDENGKKLPSRSFEMLRSVRLHWIRKHIDECIDDNVIVFSCEDRDQNRRKDIIRTYIYNTDKKYVIILEPQRNITDYYLLTAYYLSEKKGKKQIRSKYKNRLSDIY